MLAIALGTVLALGTLLLGVDNLTHAFKSAAEPRRAPEAQPLGRTP